MKMQLRILRLRLSDDSAKGDDATYLQGSGLYRAVAMGEFSGQVLRLITPATKTCRWGPRLRPPMATFSQDDKL